LVECFDFDELELGGGFGGSGWVEEATDAGGFVKDEKLGVVVGGFEEFGVGGGSA